MAVLSLRGLDVTLGRRPVVRAADLDLEVGVTALLGANGAGKTTLLRACATLVTPSAGGLEIAGAAVVDERSARAARRRLGYLPQRPGVPAGFTVAEYLTYCAWAREVPAGEREGRVEEVLGRVDLGRWRTAKLRTLSGGTLQRVTIAQALVGRPQVLLLDEPTVGLDPEQRLAFRALVRDLSGMAVLLSTHLTDDVGAACQRVVVMREGRLVFHGEVADLADLGRDAPAEEGTTMLERGYVAVLRAAAAQEAAA